MNKLTIAAIGIAALVAIPVGLSVTSLLSSVASAPGRVISKTMETNNIISNYEWYHDSYAAFRARTSQVEQFRNLLAAEPDAKEKQRLRIEFSAIQQSCREIATKYNANSTKTNRSIFKGREAPEKLPENQCE